MSLLAGVMAIMVAAFGFIWNWYVRRLKDDNSKLESRLSEFELNEVKRSISDEVNKKELDDLVADTNKRYGSGSSEDK